jgi:hypothetical protein
LPDWLTDRFRLPLSRYKFGGVLKEAAMSDIFSNAHNGLSFSSAVINAALEIFSAERGCSIQAAERYATAFLKAQHEAGSDDEARMSIEFGRVVVRVLTQKQ